jgi:AbiU2
VGAFAVKPRACGAPLCGFGAWPLSATEQTTASVPLMHTCDAQVRESDSQTVERAVKAANATLAAIIVQKALLQRVLMTVERSFAPSTRRSDRHARVALNLLSNQTIFDEVANTGSRKHLQQACATWQRYDADPRRKRLKHYRDKVVAHTAERNPAIPVPLVTELRN